LDNMSVYDWIESRVPGGHGSPLGMLLEVAYHEEYAVDTRVQSSLNLVYLLAFQPTPGNFSIFGLSDERYHIVAGNQRLPQVIAETLGIGSTVKPGWRMTRIAKRNDGTYDLFFGKTRINADYAVMCLP